MAGTVQVRQRTLGAYDNNVYVIVDPSSNLGILVDAPTDADAITDLIGTTSIQEIVLTHGDADHVQALAEMKKRLGVPVVIHEADNGMLPAAADSHIRQGDQISVGSASLRVVHTPGHTPGSVCLVGDGFVISGDTLFPGGPGNTKRPNGNFADIIAGIRDQLFVLPDDFAVYPGHGKSTTIGDEKPHLQDWIARGW